MILSHVGSRFYLTFTQKRKKKLQSCNIVVCVALELYQGFFKPEFFSEWFLKGTVHLESKWLRNVIMFIAITNSCTYIFLPL